MNMKTGFNLPISTPYTGWRERLTRLVLLPVFCWERYYVISGVWVWGSVGGGTGPWTQVYSWLGRQV